MVRQDGEPTGHIAHIEIRLDRMVQPDEIAKL
jgi:hypothetical protein